MLNHPRRAIALCAILLMLLSLTSLHARSAALGNLQAVFLNVGQGDSMLLRDANGFDVLIDGGETYAGPTVVAYLRQQGVDDIDVLVASHPDSDHIGGLIDVLQATDIPIRAVVINGYPGASQAWTDFLASAALRSLTPTVAQFPAEYTWGEMTVHVLNPPPGLTNPASNDASLVLLVDHGAVNFLFTGDIPSAVESQVVALGTPVAAEVLKVAHHGSAYSSSSSFLGAVGARDSIIEVGAVNDYGHPDADTLQRLDSAGAAVWRTDHNGNVTVRSDGIGYTISGEISLQRVYLPVLMRQTSPDVPPETDTGNMIIGSIFYDGLLNGEPDEYVEVTNADTHAINLQNWSLRDNAGTLYTFPTYSIQPNQTCRVYTNQAHPETCGFNYGRGSAIWNNTGDCAFLRNAQGQDVNSKCYP